MDPATDDLGTLGGTSSTAKAINAFGQVVGNSQYVNGGNKTHAFLYSNGTMHDLNNLIPADSGWVLKEGAGINDFGQIVVNGCELPLCSVFGRDDVYYPRAFLLTPTLG